ncbi:MAG: DUF4403 family protein [Alphaproteobacteria bacterium]|nr:DUF4403 family protein [Alphaproteobacteria bacterium]
MARNEALDRILQPQKPRRALPFGLTVRSAVAGLVVLVLFFGGTLWGLNKLFPGNPMEESKPATATLSPLQPMTRTSVVVAPVAVAALAIRDVLEANAPRGLTGKNDNPLAELLGKAEISWNIARGPIGVSGNANGLNITTSLNGSIRVTGQLSNQGGQIAGAMGGLLGGKLGGEVQKLTGRALDQRADIRGNVSVMSRPALLPTWRIEPNLSGQVSIGEGGLQIAGIKLNISNEVKPLLDKNVNEQIANLSNKLRGDRTLENAARKQWTLMCRSIPLGKAAPNAPALWLEVKPTRAIAAQPKILTDWVILTLGVQAETRIVPAATTPTCPFPERLDLVGGLEQGKVSISVPIDMPFAELNRLMELQFKNKTFPETGNAPGQVTVLASNISAAGDRLLISLRVKARETKSWFGFGGEATVHVWGKPTLDQQNQIMRLTNISLDVKSEAAFGLLGTAARAAIPYLQKSLADNAVIDLKPFAANALKSIDGALADFKKPTDGVEVEADATALRLTGIEFDSNTLRVIGEAEGTARALVRKIALQ